MDEKVFETQLLKLLKLHAPVKARQLATMLTDEFALHVDRSDVNSALYRMQTAGLAKVDKSYEWRAVKGAGKTSTKKPAVEPIVTSTPVGPVPIDDTPANRPGSILERIRNTLTGGGKDKAPEPGTSSTSPPEQISSDTPPAEPAIAFTAEQQAVIDLDPSDHLLIRGQAGSGKTTVLAARAGKLL